MIAPFASAQTEAGFKPLFNRKNLDGWTLVRATGPGYVVEGDRIVCPANGGGNLFTAKEYANFVFRFEFRLTPGANNGIGIAFIDRAAGRGNPAIVTETIASNKLNNGVAHFRRGFGSLDLIPGGFLNFGTERV